MLELLIEIGCELTLAVQQGNDPWPEPQPPTMAEDLRGQAGLHLSPRSEPLQWAPPTIRVPSITNSLVGFSPARFVQVTVETEISSSEALREQNDLIGVARKMFYDVEDGREHCRVVALNGDLFCESPVWQSADQIHRLTHGAAQR